MRTRWEDIQQEICRKCIDGDGRGNCRLPADETCAIQSNFDHIVQTVGTSEASDIEGYIEDLRSSVCSACVHQDAHGNCWKRNRLDCALDRYYPVVIRLIEHQLSLTG